MSVLRNKQVKFAKMLPRLLDKAFELGYEVTRLALDLNLFLDGAFLTTTEGHRPLGEFWESIGGSWGGRFNDANHYSLEHNGVR